jgi:hypothetical protein
MDDALSTILESPTVERLATGFGFTEGPPWHPICAGSEKGSRS